MKFTVTMKDPDTLHDAIVEAVKEEVDRIPALDDDEKEDVTESRTVKVVAICNKWFDYGEYLSVEIDTDAETCVVKPR
jgi:hypothetical protein